MKPNFNLISNNHKCLDRRVNIEFINSMPNDRTGLYWEKGDRPLSCSITSAIATHQESAATHPNQPQKKNPVTPHLMIQVEKPRASQFGIQYWGQPHQFDGLVGGG
jgi:hypothetical protein